MALKNSEMGYGLVARALHWGMALAIFAMFGLGIWMRSLDYYSPYYQTAPDFHKSAGLVLLVLLLARYGWRLINIKPNEDYLPTFERVISQLVHWGLYALMLALMISGYFISTADGRPIAIFGLVEIPSIYQQTGLENTAGFIHEYLAYGLMGLALIHALAALKHHFIDRDITLSRMVRSIDS